MRTESRLQDIIDAQLGPVGILMQRPKLNWAWKLGHEQKLSVKFADALRYLETRGRVKCVWTHVANEGKRHAIVGAIQKAMGMISGSPDYVFAWKDGCGFIELKVHPNGLEKTQKCYKQWCEQRSVNYAMHKAASTSDEDMLACVKAAMDTLKAWGAIV